MKIISIERSSRFALIGIAAVFIISRILYKLVGIQFQGDTYLGYWQFIDPVLLQKDLWRSVFYLHSQPPLMNLFTGIILQIFPVNHDLAFYILYFIGGLILAVSIYFLGLCLRFPSWFSTLLSVWFMVSPSTILYEHWLFYTYLLTVILSLVGVLLYQFISSGKSQLGLIFFSLLACVTLTWSLFHIVWLFGIAALLLIFGRDRKKILLTSLLPLILVTGWYLKNLVVVGEFTASSWAGMNISKIATFRTPQKERRQMVKSGELSKFALLPPFRNPQVYLKLLPKTPLTGIPVLDETETSFGRRNQHHLVYVEASRYYLHDALHMIRSEPGYYARSIVQAIYIYLHSSSDFDLTSGNRNQIAILDTWWNRLFYGQWQSNETSADRGARMSAENIGWSIFLGFFAVMIGSIQFLWKRRDQLGEPENILVLFMIYNILFVSIVGNLMDIGENNRFRYVIDPFLMILFVFFLRNAISAIAQSKSTDPSQLVNTPINDLQGTSS